MKTERVVLTVILLACTAAFLYSGIQSRRAASSIAQIDNLASQITALRTEVRRGLSGESDATAQNGNESETTASDKLELKSASDATSLANTLREDSKASELSKVLEQIDSWIIQPEDDSAVAKIKETLVVQLRLKVKQEVIALQQAALKAGDGSQAAVFRADAGATLALYPMSSDDAVVAEAKSLSTQQGVLAGRLEVLRRQRYNQWAAKQVELAINGYNKSSSLWSPKKENKLLIDSLVESLGPVDPAVIEPAVLELYNYVLDLTKGSISQTDQIDLAKRLTDPTIQRKLLGDF